VKDLDFMRHVFVINPDAGRGNARQEVEGCLAQYAGSDAVEVHVTATAREAADYIRATRGRVSGPLRFYACGGDGTLNAVVNAAWGLPDVAVGCYPSGSGNDYVKYYGGIDAFLDLERQLAGEAVPVDLMQVNGLVAINMVHFGLDSRVAQTMERVRRWPLLGGKNAYPTGVASALLQPLGHRCTVWAGDERLNDDKLLLCTIACGQYVGGSYRAAPRSDNADGLLDVCLVKPLSRMRLAPLMNAYKQGTHLEDPRIQRELVYRRATRVRIRPQGEFVVLLDGELHHVDETEVRVLPSALSFVVPKGIEVKTNPAPLDKRRTA